MNTRHSVVTPRTVRDGLKARRAFLDLRGPEAADARAKEIAALPAVEWKGHTLHTILCNGTSGRGPHNVNAPEGLLWALVDLRTYLCPYHHGDGSLPASSTQEVR